MRPKSGHISGVWSLRTFQPIILFAAAVTDEGQSSLNTIDQSAVTSKCTSRAKVGVYINTCMQRTYNIFFAENVCLTSIQGPDSSLPRKCVPNLNI